MMPTLTMRGVRLCWFIMVFVMVAIVMTPRRVGKLYPTFATAGHKFYHAESLYCPVPEHLDQFRYSPTLAVLLVPWSLFPVNIGGALWRMVQAGALFWALRQTRRTFWPEVSEVWFLLGTLPLIAGNIFNGQLNPIMLTAMLMAGVWYARGYYGWAAFAVTLAVSIKVYPLALALLLLIGEPRRFTPWCLLWMVLSVLFPYLWQDVDYVTMQYRDWWQRLTADDRSFMAWDEGYHDFQKLLRRSGIVISLATYRLVEVVAGAWVAIWAWGLRRTPREQQTFIMLMSLVWCCLFGPSSESATYMLLAPVVVMVCWRQPWLIIAYLLLVGVTIGMWFPKHIRQPYMQLIPQAHAALLVWCWLLWQYRPGQQPRAIYSVALPLT